MLLPFEVLDPKQAIIEEEGEREFHFIFFFLRYAVAPGAGGESTLLCLVSGI